MKILYFLPHITNSGGMERIVIDKINYLSEKGYHIYLAFFGNSNDSSFYAINSNVRKIIISDYYGTPSIVTRIIRCIQIIKRLKCIISETSPNVIINANTPLVSWILPFVYIKIPKVFEFHFSYQGIKMMNKEIYGNNIIKIFINDLLRKSIYPLYTYCIALTNDDMKAWGFKNMCVIPNFTKIEPSSLPKFDSPSIISVGRLSYPKNYSILLDAFSIIKKRRNDIKLDIWGNGEEYEYLTKKICNLELNDIVTLKGVSHSIENEYNNYSLFVLPSRYEGFPLVIVEAMLSGLPCIGFDISGIRAIIQDGFNGRIVKERTPEALADAIIETIKDKNELMRMSKNAVTSIQRFNMDTVMNMWINLFEELKHKKNETYR